MAIRLLSSESIDGALTLTGIIQTTGANLFYLGKGVYTKATNSSNDVDTTNIWGYGLYEGASKIAEISLVRDGSSNQMYIGTTTANQTLRIGTANKVTALTINASQDSTFAGTLYAPGIQSTSYVEAATPSICR